MKKIISQLFTLQTLSVAANGKNSADAAAIRENIPAAVLERFDKFVVRGKKPVALVQNGVCRGCQIQLPLNVINSLINGLDAVTCGNCGRYLLLLEEDAVAFRDRNLPAITVPKPKAPKLRSKSILPRTKKSRKPAAVAQPGR